MKNLSDYISIKAVVSAAIFVTGVAITMTLIKAAIAVITDTPFLFLEGAKNWLPFGFTLFMWHIVFNAPAFTRHSLQKKISVSVVFGIVLGAIATIIDLLI